MEEEKSKSRYRFLVFLVGALLVAVGVQTYFLACLIKERDAGAADTISDLVAPSAQADAAPQLKIVPRDEGPSTVPPAPQPQIQPQSPDPFGMTSPWRNRGQSYDPFAEMRRMQEEMDRIFDGALGRMRTNPGFSGSFQDPGFMPQLDLTDNGSEYVIRFDIPGADEADVKVSIDDRVLTVEGDISQETQQSDGNQVLRMERKSGHFQRSVMLPGSVDSEKMNVHHEDGVLTITIPKMEKIPAKRTNTI